MAKPDKIQDSETPAESRDAWKTRLADIGAKEGFYEELGTEHTALFVERGKTLVVTFDNMDHVYERGEDRMPWGFAYTKSRGWSVLGLMAHDWTWYRDDAVYDFFDRLRDQGFFEKFDNVVFYGASMGAYAACVFSSASPGATVVCISPQATLDRTIAGWETRYKKVWRRNFKDRYGYAPDKIKAAKKAYLFYDPTAQLDAMHASLFQSDNVVKLKCRFMGHRIASLWAAMGILKPITEGCFDGTITPQEVYRLLRKRRTSTRYQKELLLRLRDQNRHALLVRYARYILSKRRGPHFRNEMNNSLKILKRGK